MANIKDWLVNFEKDNDELIKAIVVGKHDNSRYNEKETVDENVVLGRDEGLRKLDYEFDNGYGGADCHPITAWTNETIIYICEYDGATGLSSRPRNPTNHKPEFS